ncbi:MAG: hypothetical protein M3336_07970 [Chloroflexota bacterium]|nr:hypothetical protein [Chloroflexota bacterium]
MSRWVAIALGAISALGMQALFDLLTAQAGLGRLAVAHYLGLFAALVLGGYVAGHLVRRWHALHGALAAATFIFVSVTINALREAPVARELGLQALPPIDFVQLTITDLLAMTGGSWGGWLAGYWNRRGEGLDRLER